MKKKVFRQALTIVLFATLAAVVSHWLSKRANSPSVLATSMAQPSPQNSLPLPKFDGTPNRTLPSFVPLESLPQIPANPTDDQIVQCRVLPDRLWPVDAPGSVSDNAELGALLLGLRGKSEAELYAGIEKWLASHKDSRWRYALQSQLMNYKWNRGWFAEARAGWLEVWSATKDREDLNSYHLANDVLARLLESHASASRVEQLRSFVDAALKRPLNGALEGRLYKAKEALWLLEHTAAQNVMCGPLALNAIKEYRGEPYIAPRLSQVPPEFQQTGLSLKDVQRYAQNDYKLTMQPARRDDAAQRIPTPAVMHVKDDHYCALLDQSPDGKEYLLADRTLGVARWVDAAAVDAMSSGTFLVAAAELPRGFSSMVAADAQKIFGRDGAHGTMPPDEEVREDSPKTKKPCGGEDSQSGNDGWHFPSPPPPAVPQNSSADNQTANEGMPTWTFHPIPGAIRIGDVPLRYSPPVGPRVAFQINYNDADSGAPTSPPTWSHVGVTWSTNWVAWVEHVAGAPSNGSTLRVRVPGGGTEVQTYSTVAAQYGPHPQTFAVVKKTGAYTYTRELPDGSKQIFNSPNSLTSPSRVFLTELEDPRGNKLTFAYDTNTRLVSVTDSIGQVTTLDYTDAGNIYRITRVTDPFGRFCSMTYDTAGRLTGITDQINLTTTFAYDQFSGFISTMVTPYGTSTFELPVNSMGSNRIVEATDPLGSKERVEYNDTGSTLIPSLRSPPKSVTVGGTVVGFYAEDSRLQFRNAWYWNKLQSEVAPGDYKAARNYRFYTNVNWQVVPVIETIKEPQEDRVWFNYPGGVLFDGSGFPYFPGASAAPEKVLRMLPDGTPQLRQSYTNAQGRIIRTVDPLGRSTQYSYAANGLDMTEIRQTTGGINERLLTVTYNAQHQPLTLTDAAGSVTSYTYNARGQVLTITNPLNEVTTFTYDGNGYLTTVDSTLVGSADSITLTYDALGRVRTTTNSDGYIRTYSYDDFDRVTQIDYPDGTNEKISYNKLDRATFTDRMNRVTSYTYDAVQQLTQVTDPLLRVIKTDWCRCGSLASITDPKGNITRWQRDIQGRVTAKINADNSRVAYSYDSAGRMVMRTDEKGQNKLFDYFADDSVKQVSYPNAEVATASVFYDYDTNYDRMTSMRDGIGTTLYGYHALTGGISPGAGSLSSLDGPFPDDTITFSYDALGRVVGRAVNGVGAQVSYDSLGRITNVTDALGVTTATFEGATDRPSQIMRPNGVTTNFTYFDNGKDRRLSQIENLGNGAVSLSTFTYDYDAVGRITTWSQKTGGAAVPDVWTMSSDAIGQLQSVAVSRNNVNVSTSLYSYDAAGNRVTAAASGVTRSSTYDSLNRLLDQDGTLANRTYQWDAENRLVSVTFGTKRSEFGYDGGGLCRQIREFDGKTQVDGSTFVWDGMMRIEKRDAVGRNVLARYFTEGVQYNSGPRQGTFIYATDHLGSIREVVNAAGMVEKSFQYTPFGETAATAPGFADEIGFTHHYRHVPSGLYLAPFRALDTSLGRWLSRDPIDLDGGLNVYRYVSNDPINFIDPTGMRLWYADKASDACMRPVIKNLMKSRKGRELLAKLHNDPNKTYYIHCAKGINDAYQQGDDVYVDPDFHPTIQTDKGPRVATTNRILAHELGHLTGTLDDGPNQLNNVNTWENPIMGPLEGANRTVY